MIWSIENDQVFHHKTILKIQNFSKLWLCFECCFMLFRCRWWDPISSPPGQLQWPVWTKLHQGTFRLVHTSSNTNVVAARHQHFCLLFVCYLFDHNSRFSWVLFLPTCCADHWKTESRERQRSRGNIALSVIQSASVLSMLGYGSCCKPSFTTVIIPCDHWGSVPKTQWNDP